MIEIDNFSTKKESGMQDVQGPVEADPEYLLIVEVNNLAAQIDEEIGMVNTMFISTPNVIFVRILTQYFTALY